MINIDIADLDVIFLTYDEPKKEEFWVRLKNTIPWAKRVDGVKGSDSAHKTAAQVSDTERFILIDGDNIPDSEFFNLTLSFPDTTWQNAVYRWRARNHINGLMYGNGGISSWTRSFVFNMRTHENTDGRTETQVEFCFDPLYWAMHDCYSTTYPNGSPQQAWRAGFREGVKMSLNRGQRPAVKDFARSIVRRNFDNLSIWCNVGADVENGHWAMAGARMGTAMTMTTDWNYQEVQCFDSLDKIWSTIEFCDPHEVSQRYGDQLSTQLGLPMIQLDAEASKFFKYHLNRDWVNQGVMTREIDIIHKSRTC